MGTNEATTNEHYSLGTIKIMMYMFPRQFGLHNVFTSKVDASKTTQPFQDYALREYEIKELYGSREKDSTPRLPRIPKRLRGKAVELVKKLQILHGRCAYAELLHHYCPVRISTICSSPPKS